MKKPTALQCAECGAPVTASARHSSAIRFCCKEHRDDFTNRRKLRGAALYDMMMAMRFDRKNAADMGVWAIACRMMSEWNAEDKEAGRPNTQPLKQALEANVRHTAVRVR